MSSQNVNLARQLRPFLRWAGALLLALAGAPAFAVVQPWQPADAEAAAIAEADRWVRPRQSRAFRLDPATLRGMLASAPREFTPAALAPLELALPMPDGTMARFRICESPVMAAELAALFPEIKTYCGQGIDDPAATVRLDTTPAGFHAQILSPSGAAYIDPARQGDAGLHLSYFRKDFSRDLAGFECLTVENEPVVFQPAAMTNSGPILRTYRLAVAATGEYTQFHGGTVAAGLAAIVTAVNRVDGIYETELAIRLVLVANNQLLVFTNAATDPFSNAAPSSLIASNQVVIDAVIGNLNYDVGHVFGTAGQGLSAAPGVVCYAGQKAKGETGLPSPVGDPFVIDFVAHELGHQFGAFHSYGGLGGACAGSISTNNSYEPGSGSTIMAYAGICATDDLQPHTDPYFHAGSMAGIQFYIGVIAPGPFIGGDCAVTNATANLAPFADAGPDYVIPKGTPFTLTAVGSDANGDTLTYCWEEFDRGPGQALTGPDNGISALFRSFPPTISPARTFPRLSDLLNNTITPGEKLPAVSRTNKFRVTVRDNRAGGGGVTYDDLIVTVVGAAGPFLVTAPNTAVSWSGTQTVTWNVAGTTNAPINATNVDILLSTDGGLTFPILLATNTPNDGSQSLMVPNLPTTTARIKIMAVGNIFFDISDVNFTIPPIVLPALTIADAAGIEGNAGRTDALFALQLSAPSAQVVTVNFATANGSALAGADYVATNGTAQFTPGQTNQTLRVGVLGDTLIESNEAFTVTLSNPANATLARATATGTILDDEVLLSAMTVSNAHVQLQFNTVTGAAYRVESSPFLPNTNLWNAVPGATLLNGTGGLLQLLDPNALAQPQRFYRVRRLD